MFRWLDTLQAKYNKLALVSACFALALGCAQPLWAQESTPPAFDVDIQAPDDVKAYLERHLELYRYRDLTDLDTSELERLIADVDRNARDLLATLGYFSPDITARLNPNLAQTVVPPATPKVVSIVVAPGLPTRIGTVDLTFSGPLATDSAAASQRVALSARWPLRPGMVFTQTAWDNAKTRSRQLLTSQRYPVGEITSSLADIDSANRMANLHVNLDSGPAYRLGRLEISGVQRYDPELVTRVARLKPGADYDQADLQDAQQRLVESGYFDSVFVTLDTAGDAQAAPVLVQVREAKQKKIVLGVGISTDSGPRLSVEHTNHWLPYIGWRAVSKLSLDRDVQSVETELTSTPDEDNWRWVTSGLLKQDSGGAQDVSSQRLRVGRTQIGGKIDRNYYLQYDRAKTYGAGNPVTADSISVNYAWTQRNFDSLPFPNGGYGLGVEVGGGTTLGNNREPFFRTRARWLGIWSLENRPEADLASSRAGRIALRAEGGAVMARVGAVLPSTQLFLTGGDKTVRGYSFESLGSTQANGQTTAGRYLAVGSIEWQRPITSGDKLTGWEGVLFVDAGAVADKPSELKAKVGVGAGVRLNSPVGPLEIDLAYGLATKSLRLHLSIGFAF